MKKSLFFRLKELRYICTSLYFNIYYFGWKEGLKLPIVFYCPVKLRNMKGSITIEGKKKHSMVSIGLPGNEMFAYNTPCIWANQGGQVIFKGTFSTNAGAAFIIRPTSILTFGGHSSFGQNLRILCSKQIEFGNELLGSWDVTIMDTDSHFFVNTETKQESCFSKTIKVGNHCFIGNGVSIQKGSVIPDGSVIAAKSVVTKNLHVSNALFGGIPAVLIKKNINYLK